MKTDAPPVPSTSRTMPRIRIMSAPLLIFSENTPSMEGRKKRRTVDDDTLESMSAAHPNFGRREFPCCHSVTAMDPVLCVVAWPFVVISVVFWWDILHITLVWVWDPGSWFCCWKCFRLRLDGRKKSWNWSFHCSPESGSLRASPGFVFAGAAACGGGSLRTAGGFP